jgi:hypothetical protein
MKNKKRKSKIEQSAERKTCDSIGPNEPDAELHTAIRTRARERKLQQQQEQQKKKQTLQMFIM